MTLITVVFIGVCGATEEPKVSIAFSLENFDFRQLFIDNKSKLGFDVEVARITNSDMKVEVLSRIDSRSLPDAIIMPADMLGLARAQFSTIPDDWISPDISTSAKDLAKVNNRLKGIPIIAGNHLLLYYNKQHIKSPAPDWQTLENQRSELNQGTSLKNVELIGWPYHEAFWILPFLSAFDALPYVNGEIRLNTDGTRKAFQFLVNLNRNNKVSANCNYNCNQNKFVSGQLAYTINGIWAYGNYSEKLQENLGVATLPMIGDKTMRSYKSAHVLAFPNDGLLRPKMQLLKKLAKLMQSPDIQRRLWVEKKALPTNAIVEEEVLKESNDHMKAVIAQLGQSEPMPNDEVMAIIWEAIIIGFNRFDGDAMSVEQATNYMQYIAEKSRDEL